MASIARKFVQRLTHHEIVILLITLSWRKGLFSFAFLHFVCLSTYCYCIISKKQARFLLEVIDTKRQGKKEK